MYYRQQVRFCNPEIVLDVFAVTSSLFSTSIVVEQIERLGLLVNVVFLGDRLTETVRRLESSSKTVGSGAGSYLVFHYTPSPLALDFNLTTVKFEPCDQGCVSIECLMTDL